MLLPEYWGVWVVRSHENGIHIVRRTACDLTASEQPYTTSSSWKDLSEIAAETMAIDELEHIVFGVLHARDSLRPASR